jgi:hypothetical protein
MKLKPSCDYILEIHGIIVKNITTEELFDFVDIISPILYSPNDFGLIKKYYFMKIGLVYDREFDYG